MSRESPVFYYDFNSPYAWLAAERIDSILPGPALWQPISYAFVIRHTGVTSWSLKPGREAGMKEIEERAARRGLSPLRWPPGWPVETYSLPALRAAVFAAQRDQIEAFTLAAFRQQFEVGRGLSDFNTVLRAASSCRLDQDDLLRGIEQQAIKAELKRATEEAIERGVTGVPTVCVGEELFWGDDRLEQAAAAIRRCHTAS